MNFNFLDKLFGKGKGKRKPRNVFGTRKYGKYGTQFAAPAHKMVFKTAEQECKRMVPILAKRVAEAVKTLQEFENSCDEQIEGFVQ